MVENRLPEKILLTSLLGECEGRKVGKEGGGRDQKPAECHVALQFQSDNHLTSCGVTFRTYAVESGANTQ